MVDFLLSLRILLQKNSFLISLPKTLCS